VLDLTRGCLRAGDQDIALRPKAFEVLRYLAQNAGRLVAKQELYEAVWPNVTVSDASIVQCIRELRDKLSDNDHSLIKTVSRRGYLLDAAVSAGAPQCLADGPMPPEGPRAQLPLPQRVRMMPAHQLRVWLVIMAGLKGAAWSTIYLLGWPVSGANPGHVGSPPLERGVRAKTRGCD
jgi:DNA-binding winged helix-turn-helix (wHTH) protein